MTKKELIELIKKYPDNIEITKYNSYNGTTSKIDYVIKEKSNPYDRNSKDIIVIS